MGCLDYHLHSLYHHGLECFNFCCKQICWTFLEVKCKEGHDSQGDISNYCSLKYNLLNFIHSVFIKKHTRNAILPQKTAWQKKNVLEQLLLLFTDCWKYFPEVIQHISINKMQKLKTNFVRCNKYYYIKEADTAAMLHRSTLPHRKNYTWLDGQL